MSYTDKLAKTEQIIAEHNKLTSINTSTATSGSEIGQQLSWETIQQRLIALGATSEEALAQCTWEDLEQAGMPRLLARRIANEVFRVKPAGSNHVSDRSAERMTTEELLARYNPDQPLPNAVAQRLKTLSKGAKFIVFASAGVVDVPASVKLLDEIQKGFGAREVYVGPDSRPRNIYAVGDKPNNLVDQNPLYPGRILRPDGTCDQTNRSWEGVKKEVRVLLYLAVSRTREADVTMSVNAHTLFDLAVREDAEKAIRSRFPKASVIYDELNDRNELPSLRVALKQAAPKDFIGGDNRTY